MDIRKIILVLGLLCAATQTRALSLGGTFVPKEKVIVYLLIGHSNMVGQDLAHSDGTTDPHVFPASAEIMRSTEVIGATRSSFTDHFTHMVSPT